MISTGQNWKKWQFWCGNREIKFSMQKKPETNGEEVKAWVFQAESLRFDSWWFCFLFSFTPFFPSHFRRGSKFVLIRFIWGMVG